MMHAMARTLLISLRYRVQLLLSCEDEVCKTVRVVISTQVSSRSNVNQSHLHVGAALVVEGGRSIAVAFQGSAASTAARCEFSCAF